MKIYVYKKNYSQPWFAQLVMFQELSSLHYQQPITSLRANVPGNEVWQYVTLFFDVNNFNDVNNY